MGLALTPNGPKIGTIALPSSNDNGDALIAGLDALVTAAGWETIGAWAPNGHEYRLTSPQGLKCRCRISKIRTNRIGVQFASADGTIAGTAEELYYISNPAAQDTVPTLSVWANCCSIFTYVDGANSTSNNQYRFLQGGIPYTGLVDPSGDCAASGAAAVTDFWFSLSDNSRYGGVVGGFRESCYLTPYQHWSGDYNGTLYTKTAGGTPQVSLVFPMAPAITSDDKYFPAGLRWLNAGRPLYVDPIIQWDQVTRGILYDAVIRMEPTEPDVAWTWEGTHWQTYTGNASLGFPLGDWGHTASLSLLTAAVSAPVYFAY